MVNVLASMDHYDTSNSDTGQSVSTVYEEGDKLTLGDQEPKICVPVYRVYKRRWFVLFIAALLTYSSQLLWLSFSPAASVVAQYYNVSDNSINLFSIMYLILSVPMGFVATWMLDTYGLRPSLLIGAWVTAIGSIVRIFSVLPFVPQSWSFPVVLAGQVISASAYPIFISCPAKVSEKWFGENQRAFATMVVSSAIGYSLSNVISPIIIKNNGVPLLLIVYAVPATLGALLVTFGMCSSTPPTPPSPSAAVQMQPYWKGLKQISKNWSFLLYIAVMGVAGGLFNTFNVLAEEMLCSQGYTPTFTGWALGLQSGIGWLGGLAGSLFIDKTKLFEEGLKVTQALAAVMNTVVLVVAMVPNMEALILVCNILSGIFSSATFPIVLELAVEITYPVAEATSVGLLLISMHLQGIIFTFVLESLGRPMTDSEKIHQKCIISRQPGGSGHSLVSHLYQDSAGGTSVSEPKDMTVAMMVYTVLVCLQAITLIVCLRTTYRRRNAEKLLHAEERSSVNAAEGCPDNASVT